LQDGTAEFGKLGKEITQRLGDELLVAQLDRPQAVDHYVAGDLDDGFD
jgi:hypothetical protein